MELIFERSKKGHGMDLFPALDVPAAEGLPLRERRLICRSWMRWSWTAITGSWKSRPSA